MLIPCERSCSKSVIVDRDDALRATESLIFLSISDRIQRVVSVDKMIGSMLKVIDAVRDNRGGFQTNVLIGKTTTCTASCDRLLCKLQSNQRIGEKVENSFHVLRISVVGC